jgi:hypothetical protein
MPLVYPRTLLPSKPSLEWLTRDEELCKAPPLTRRPHARAEIKLRFPGIDL